MIKKSLGLLVVALMLLNLGVFAAPKDDVLNILTNPIYNGKLKMEMSLEIQEISDALKSYIKLEGFPEKFTLIYDMAYNMSPDLKKMQIAMKVNLPVELGGGMGEMESYVDMDLTDSNAPKMMAITKIPQQEKYVYMDYNKMPDGESFFKFMKQYDPNTALELNQLFLQDVKEEDLKVEGGKYTLTFSEAQLMKLVKQSMDFYAPLLNQPSFNQLLGEEGLEGKMEEWLKILGSIKLFDDPAMIYSLSVDEKKNLDKMNIALFVDINIVELVKAFASEMELSSEDLAEMEEELPKDQAGLKMKLAFDYDYNEIGTNVKVEIPVLTEENSMDGLAQIPQHELDFDKINVMVGGAFVDFDEVEPIVVEGRTLVPLRKLANVLGIPNENIAYDNGVITLKDQGKTITLTVDQTEVTLETSEGIENVTLDVPATVINGRTLVPLRFIAETFNCNVAYNQFEGHAGGIVTLTPAE